jgi:hypothetical protein
MKFILHNYLDQIIQEKIELYKQQKKSFSYSGYFRKPRCRFEYNLKAGIVDNRVIINKLLKGYQLGK